MDEQTYFETIGEYRLLAKHEVGQNFLIDPSVSKRIVDLLEASSSDKVLEIGSGAGSLSYFLSKSEADSTLIDIDEGLVAKLQSDFKGMDNIHPIKQNVMRYDLSSYTKIIGNLPYYITSGIIERVLLGSNLISKAVLMVQKEAFSRLSAKIGSKDYGPLPILLEYRCKIKKEFIVPRTSFAPAPHIDSMVFSLGFKEGSNIETASSLYKLVSALFLHRRKTVLNNLSSYIGSSSTASSLLREAKIDEKKRPEDISLEEYQNLLSQLH